VARGGVTVSIGVALVGRDDRGVSELLARADAALYRAKHEGRNRVVRAG
jgi:diguanylate cyclase (GGDEF)-like protein